MSVSEQLQIWSLDPEVQGDEEHPGGSWKCRSGDDSRVSWRTDVQMRESTPRGQQRSRFSEKGS